MAESEFDHWGNAIPFKKQPGSGWPHVVQGKDRIYQYSIKGLSPDRVWSAFTSAYNGDVSALQAIFEQAYRHDGKLYALDQRRRNGLAGLDIVLRPYVERPHWGEEAGKAKPRDIKLCDQVADIFYAIPNLRDHIKSFASAIGQGFAIAQVNWVRDGSVLRPFLRFIPQRKFTWLQMSNEDEITEEMPNILTDANLTYGEELDPNRYIMAGYRDAVEIWKSGVMWPCLWWYLRKHEAWAQLMATGERFAEPALLGYMHPDLMNGPLASTTEDALENVGPGTTIIVPGTGAPLKTEDNGAYIDTLSADLKIPKEFWGSSIEQCDREMAIAWTGGNLPTDTTGGTGTLAAAKSQRGSEIEDIRYYDAEWAADGFMDRLIQLITLFNFGPDAAEHRPVIEFPGLQPAEDTMSKATMYKTVGETDWDAVQSMPEAIRQDLDLPELPKEEEPEDEPEPAQEPPGEPQEPEEQGGVPEPMEEGEEPESTPEQRADEMLAARDDGCSCGHFEAQAPGVAQLRDEIFNILQRVDPYNKAAVTRIRKRTTTHLLGLKSPPKSLSAFRNRVLGFIDKEYKALSTELNAAGLGKWFADTYEFYKKTDKSVWAPAQREAIVIKFGNVDRAAMRQISRSSRWYFSKFTDNETYRKSMTKFLNRTYLEQGAQLFKRNPSVVNAFGKALGKTTKRLADHEIDRIARTTVARARENARIMQMYDAGVGTAVVVTHPDACEICEPYEGKKINVNDSVGYIQAQAELSDEEWQESAKEHTQQALQGVPPHEFADDSGGGPLYHPNCRCGVDVIPE